MGVKHIDDEHRYFLTIINKACDACARGNHQAFPLIIDELLDHFREHFETEENFMAETNSPELIAHKIEHQQFYNKLVSYYSMVYEDNRLFSIKLVELTNDIYNWWRDHVLLVDKKLSAVNL